MRPFIRSGSVLFIRKTFKYRTGDLICYRDRGGLYLHRVIKKKKDIFTVSDDTGITGRRQISKCSIKGKVTPFFLSGPAGFIYRFFAVNIYRSGRKIKKIFIKP